MAGWQDFLDRKREASRGGDRPFSPDNASIEAVYRGIQTGEQGGHGRRGPGRLADDRLEDHRVVGEDVHIWGGGVSVSISSNVIGP